jgi:hypothetical protein
MTDFVANFELEQNNFDADFELENVQFDAVFQINPAGAAWGTITGRIADQTDLINILNGKVNVSQYEQDIEEINEKIDNKLDDIEGSALIEVERENQNITITSKTFVYEQGLASNEWVINHNLNKRPSIQLVDSSGKGFEAEKKYVNNNQVIIKLGSATTGKAYLN